MIAKFDYRQFQVVGSFIPRCTGPINSLTILDEASDVVTNSTVQSNNLSGTVKTV